MSGRWRAGLGPVRAGWNAWGTNAAPPVRLGASDVSAPSTEQGLGSVYSYDAPWVDAYDRPVDWYPASDQGFSTSSRRRVYLQPPYPTPRIRTWLGMTRSFDPARAEGAAISGDRVDPRQLMRTGGDVVERNRMNLHTQGASPVALVPILIRAPPRIPGGTDSFRLACIGA